MSPTIHPPFHDAIPLASQGPSSSPEVTSVGGAFVVVGPGSRTSDAAGPDGGVEAVTRIVELGSFSRAAAAVQIPRATATAVQEFEPYLQALPPRNNDPATLPVEARTPKL